MIKIKYIPGSFTLTKGYVNDHGVIAIGEDGKIALSSCLPTDLKLAEKYVQCMMKTIELYKGLNKEIKK